MLFIKKRITTEKNNVFSKLNKIRKNVSLKKKVTYKVLSLKPAIYIYETKTF